MLEAVGEAYWPVFFRTVRDRLSDGARAALQVITIDEARFDDYRRRPDFIQRYVFPGGMLPTVTDVTSLAAGAGLTAEAPAFFGADYAHTLSEWLARFDEARDGVVAMGFDERFIRTWRYYLAYCRAGFLSGSIDLMQVGLTG
jgi:cyclopropane-fatty-acyl-phospholipid synthase